MALRDSWIEKREATAVSANGNRNMSQMHLARLGVITEEMQFAAKREKLEPELVFLDVNMPGLDGLGVVRRLREKDVDLPFFIFVTAYDQYAVEAFRLEAMDYLLKPVERGRLAETIDRARRTIQEKRAPELPSAPPNGFASVYCGMNFFGSTAANSCWC